MSQTIYRRNYAAAVAGTLQGMGMPRSKPYRNSATSTYDTWTIASPGGGVASGVTITVTAGGKVATGTTAGALTQAQTANFVLNLLRSSDVYDVAVPSLNTATNVVTLTARKISLPLGVTVSGGITATNLIVASTSLPIEPGRVVARRNGDPDGTCRIPGLVTDRPIGIAHLTHFGEKDAIGNNAKFTFAANEAVDVIDRVNSATGVWVPCVETSGINEDSTVFVTFGADGGRVTANNTGTIAFPTASFASEIMTDINGKPVVLVSVNRT
jgi:hypothetical protein